MTVFVLMDAAYAPTFVVLQPRHWSQVTMPDRSSRRRGLQQGRVVLQVTDHFFLVANSPRERAAGQQQEERAEVLDGQCRRRRDAEQWGMNEIEQARPTRERA